MTATDALRRALDRPRRRARCSPSTPRSPDSRHRRTAAACWPPSTRWPAARGRARWAVTHLKRVPLATPLRLRVELGDGRLSARAVRRRHGPRQRRRDAASTRERAVEPMDSIRSSETPPADDAMPLPISAGCFACGLDNPLGLAVRLRADATAVGGTWTPRPGFQLADGTPRAPGADHPPGRGRVLAGRARHRRGRHDDRCSR